MIMFSKRAAIVLAVAGLCLTATAQNRKSKLPERYAKWLDEEVVYIITDDERKAFQRLGDDRARDEFIEDFWAVRNPSLSGGGNPYKEEHYKRIEYANQHFGRQSNTEGWRTDMGRAWILFGKPSSQARFVGGGGQLYSCELWFYSNDTGDPALPSFFNLLFYIPGDSTEYRFYRPYLDGPMSLVRGSNFNSNKDVYNYLKPYGGDLARASLSLIPSDPVDTDQFTTTMTSDMLVSRIQNLANDNFNVSRLRQLRTLHASVHSFLLFSDDRPLDLNAVAVSDPAGQWWLDYSIPVDIPELGIPGDDGKTLGITSSYQLKTDSGEIVVEDAQERSYNAFEVVEGKKVFRPFQIANRIPLAPGKYKLEVELHQAKSGKSYHGSVAITVGTPGAVAVNGPLLVASVQQAAAPDGAVPFQYFGAQFQPAGRRQFAAAKPMRVLFELSVPEPAADYEVEYVVAHTTLREARRTLSDTVKAAQFRNGRMLSSKALPLEGLPEGDYRLVLNIRRLDSRDQVLSSVNTGFHVVADPALDVLYFDRNASSIAQPGTAAYVRALAAIAQKDQTGGISYLRQAVDQNPGNTFAGETLLSLYYRLRQFADVAKLYDKLGIGPFEKSPESLVQISLSLWTDNQRERARDVLKVAQGTFPQNPLVQAAQKTVR